MENIWLDGMMGVVVGDALGCPVQFEDRETIAGRPQGGVTGMEGYGTFNVPAGSWTDDSSMSIAALDSICRKGTVDLDDIMEAFMNWLDYGKYTPFGYPYDVGITCSCAVNEYRRERNPYNCGQDGEYDNGNGSLMRIMPAVLYARLLQKNHGASDAEAMELIDGVSGLTHNHPRSKVACGIYYFLARAILENKFEHSLFECLKIGMKEADDFYGNNPELVHYARLNNLDAFGKTDASEIKGTGYVVKTLETAVWSLIGTDNFADALLRCVNIGNDTDTTAAVAGGLAGLYYGIEAVPSEWLEVIQKKENIVELCSRANGAIS